MKKQIAKNIGLCVSLLGLWPGTAAAADAVITWNENAAKAATAACIHISGNGLAESRMYAMVHVAVHDAVNAIDRRSRPYAFDANVNGLVSVDAAVAAAARDVLVSVIAKLPESPACVASGILEANALYAAALMPIPNGPGKTAGIALGQAAAAAIVALRAGDGSETTTWLDFDYPQGTEPGEWRFTPDGPPLAFASNYGQVRPFVLSAQRAVLARAAVPAHQQEVRRRLQRNQADWRRRHHHAEYTNTRPDRNRGVLDREFAVGVESPRARGFGRPRFRFVGERTVVRVVEHGHGGRVHRVMGSQVSLQLLAPDHGDPGGR